MFSKTMGGGPSRRVRVLLADDDRLFADAIALVLAADDRVEVVGHACNGARAVGLALALRPDVVLMDVHMPILDGLEATRLVRRAVPGTCVVMLTLSPAARPRRRSPPRSA